MKNPQIYTDNKGLHYLVLGPEVHQKVDVNKVIIDNLKGQFIKSRNEDLDAAALESLRGSMTKGAEVPTCHTPSYYSLDGKDVIVSSIPNAISVVSSYDVKLLGDIATAVTDTQYEPGCNLI